MSTLFLVVTNYPYRSWARGVAKAWQDELADAVAYAKSVTELGDNLDLDDCYDVYLATSKQVKKLDAFLGQWLEDAQINKGLWLRVEEKIPRSRGYYEDVSRFLDFLSKAMDALNELKNYAWTIYETCNPRMGFRYDPDTKDPVRRSWFIRGIGHRSLETYRKVDKMVGKAVKYISDLTGENKPHIPNTVDIHGVTLVFEDTRTQEIAGPVGSPTGNVRHPYTRSNVVSSADKAYSLLKRRGLDFLWYGKVHVLPREHTSADMTQYSGLKSTGTHAAAHYDWAKDRVVVFDTASKGHLASYLAHELGHRMWFKFLTETDRAEFASQFGDVEAVSEYGSSNPEEDFAEVFAHYIDGTDLTRDQLERFKRFIQKHQKRVASKALESEYPHKEWAERLYAGWKVQMEAAFDAILDAMNDPKVKPHQVLMKEMRGLQHYIDMWQRDAITNRGFQNVELGSAARDAAPFGWLAKAKEQGFELVRQRGHVDRHLELMDFYVKKAADLFAKVEYQWDDENVPEQFDLNGLTVAFHDWKPNQREGVVTEVNKAYELLKKRGLGFLWYGVIEVGTPGYFGVKSSASAWYMPHNDRFGVAKFKGGMAWSIAHEFGHRLWFKYLTETDRAEFASQFGDVPAVTTYGSKDAEEDFAEVFAAYVDGTDLTRDQLERFKRFVQKHQRKVASTKTAKPITLDKTRIRALAREIAEVVRRTATGTAPMDKRVLIKGAPFDIQGVSGSVNLLVRVQTVETRSHDYVVSGGYGKTQSGQPAVVINLNGSIPAGSLAFAANPEYGILEKDLYVLLMHELNHAADWQGGPQRPTTTHVPGMHEVDMAAYANDPSEVRAHTQEIIADIESRKSEWYPKLRKHFRSSEALQLLLKTVDAWQRIEDYLTEANKVKIMKDVWYHIQNMNVSKEARMSEKTHTAAPNILTLDTLLSIMTPMKNAKTAADKNRDTVISKRVAAAAVGTLEVSPMADFEARMRAKLGL